MLRVENTEMVPVEFSTALTDQFADIVSRYP